MPRTNSHKLMILIWDMGIGGIQKRVKDIIIDITTNPRYRNAHVYLVIKHSKPSYFIQELTEKANAKNVSLVQFSSSHRLAKSFSSLFWVWWQFLRIRPTVCLTFLDHLSAMMVLIKYLCFWQPVKVVLNEGVLTSRYIELNRGRWTFFWKMMVGVTYRLANKIIVPSAAVRDDLSQKFLVPSQKITIIPNWTLFSPKLIVMPSKKYDLLYVGRFEDEKNPFLFLQLVEKLAKKDRHLRAALMGDGKLLSKIKAYIHQKKLTKNITLLPPQGQPITVIAQTKLLVVTSKNEGIPNVVLEAGALAIPTVSSDFKGVREVITHEKDGWITSNLDEMALYASEALQNPVRLKHTGKKIQSKIKHHFSLSNQEKFIETILG